MSNTEVSFEGVESRDGGTRVLTVNGEIDVANSGELQNRLLAGADDADRVVVVDMTSVSFLDSTALGVLVRAKELFGKLGTDLRLVITAPNLLKLFEITDLTEVFAIYSTVTEAVQA